jgi:hypothetical protein
MLYLRQAFTHIARNRTYLFFFKPGFSLNKTFKSHILHYFAQWHQILTDFAINSCLALKHCRTQLALRTMEIIGSDIGLKMFANIIFSPNK